MSSRTARRGTALGLVGAALAGLGTAAALALSLPLLGTADEAAHVEHAVAVWEGRLSRFDDPVDLTAGEPLPPGRHVPPVQWTAQHPPLYYALAAPLAGPAAQDGSWRGAVLGTRAVSVVLVPVAVLAAGWAAAAARRRDDDRVTRGRTSLAVGVFATTLPALLFYGALAYNDLLAVAATCVLVGAGCLALRIGPVPAVLVPACAAAAVGLLARAPVAVPLVLTCLAVLVGALRHGAGPPLRRALRAVAASTGVGAAAVLAAGWFYLHNHRTTGRWTGGDPGWAMDVLGRRRWGLGEVLTEPGFWLGSADWFLAGRGGPGPLAVGLPALLLVAGLAAAALAAMRRHRSGGRWELDSVLVAVLLGAHVVAVLALQAYYVTTGGGVSERYTLVLLVPVLLLLTAGPLAFGRGGPWVVLVVGALAWMAGVPRLDLGGTLARGATVDGVGAGFVLGALAVAALGAALLLAGTALLHRAGTAAAGTPTGSSPVGVAPTGIP